MQTLYTKYKKNLPKYYSFRKHGWKYYLWFLFSTSGSQVQQQKGWCSSSFTNAETMIALCSSFSIFLLSFAWPWASMQRLQSKTPFSKTISVTWVQKHPSFLQLNVFSWVIHVSPRTAAKLDLPCISFSQTTVSNCSALRYTRCTWF